MSTHRCVLFSPNNQPRDQQHEPLIPSIAVQTPSGTNHHGGIATDDSSYLSPEIINVQQQQPQARRGNSDNTIFRSFPNTPYRSQNGSPDETEIGSDLSDDELPEHMPRSSSTLYSSIGNGRPRLPSSRSSSPTRTPSTVRALRKRTSSRIQKIWHNVNAFMTAPLWAAILSLFVALIQPLQHSLDVHLWPVKAAVSQAGNCSIPLTLIVLGAYFYRAPVPEEEGRKKKKDGRKSRSESRWRRVASQTSLVNSVREMFSMKGGSPVDSDSDDVEEDVWDEEERRGRRERRERRETEKAEQKGETKTVIIAIVARMVIVPALFLPVMVLGAWLDVPTVFEECVLPYFAPFYLSLC